MGFVYLTMLVASIMLLSSSGLSLYTPKNCSCKNGNCNHQTGKCECGLGFKGPSCEENVFSACMSSQMATIPGLGKRWPKSCMCWSQIHLARYLVAGSYLINNAFVAVVPFCFEKILEDGNRAPDHLQLSDVPLVNVSSYRFFRPTVNPGQGVLTFLPRDRPAAVTVTDGSTPLLPLRFCEARCNDRGACLAEPVTRCVCRQGFRGTNCSQFYTKEDPVPHPPSSDPGPLACPNYCGQRGSSQIQCHGGWCKCEAGRWGSDCSRSMASLSDIPNTVQLRTRVLVYKYDLPWHIAFPFEYDDGWGSSDPMYMAERWFSEILADDKVHYTQDITKANMFYVPLYARHYGSEAASSHLELVMAYIREQYPEIWGRHRGKDHFLWLTDDIGACGLGESQGDHPKALAIVSNPIKIVHFGLSHSHSSRKARFDNRSCFFAKKDILAPSSVLGWEDANVARGLSAKTKSRNKIYLLYFLGSWRHDQLSYSGGARQSYYTHVHLRNDSRVKFGGGSFHESQFCFVPYGQGWGNRMPVAVLHGCIPVIVQDRVYNELFDFIPFEQFTIRLRVDEVPKMVEILSRISDDEVDQMRSIMRSWERAFYWDGDGLAYKLTLQSLHKRLYGLWSMHF